MSWYWKWKPTWRKHLITYNSYPWIMFSFNWLVIIWRGGSSHEIVYPRSRAWRNFGRRWARGMGSLENWIIFMDVIYVSSLKGFHPSTIPGKPLLHFYIIKPLLSWNSIILDDKHGPKYAPGKYISRSNS